MRSLNCITGTPAKDRSFTLDALGNWTNLSTNGIGQARTANAQNQYTAVGSTPQNYDNNGNYTGPTVGSTWAYDAWNRLVSFKQNGIASDTLTYMPGDRASATDVCGATKTDSYYSMDGNVLEDDAKPVCCGGTTSTSTYCWGTDYVNDLIERDRTVSGATTRVYAQHDANWDITSLVNANATQVVLERFDYDPYGARTVLNATTWATTGDSQSWAWGFQGGWHDPISGLIHFGARDLNPTLGRWMQEDPIGAEYLDGMNLYMAFDGSPVAMLDPLGRESWTVDERTHTETLTVTVKVKLIGAAPKTDEGGWRELRFARKAKRLVESAFNADLYKAYPTRAPAPNCSGPGLRNSFLSACQRRGAPPNRGICM
jgi:RHS repeat-associated protein